MLTEPPTATDSAIRNYFITDVGWAGTRRGLGWYETWVGLVRGAGRAGTRRGSGRYEALPASLLLADSARDVNFTSEK